MSDSFLTETKEHLGHTITVKWFVDTDSEAPWEHEDGHGPVSEWTLRDKRPGERVLVTDRNSHRFYDFSEAVKIAKRDGWDAPPYKTGTPGERAVRAAERDFEYLRGWCNDAWHWAGYTVTIEGMDYDESLWGIDSQSIPRFTADAFNEAIAWLEKELANRQAAACSDIVTTHC